MRSFLPPPSFLRRQESIPVFASGGAGEKMDPRVREDDGRMRSFLPPPSFLRRPESIPVFVSYVEGKKMDLRMREDDRGSQMDPRMREDDESISPFLPPPSFLRRACPRPERGQESIPACFLTQRIHPTISGHKSRQSGLSFSINAIFQSRFHFFSCFSRMMAPVISVCISK